MSRARFRLSLGTSPWPRAAACCLLLALAAAACQHNPSGARVSRVSFITGNAGSDWDRIGSAIATRTNAAFTGQPITAVPGAGGISNPARVGRMPGDFAMGFLPFLHLARSGAAPYPQAFPDLLHVASLITNTFQLVASPSLGIRSLEDIRTGRLAVRIGTGPPGSGEEFILRETLAAYGMSYNDIREWGGRIDLIGSNERADLFRDHLLDLIAFNAVAPTAAVTELMLSRAGTFLALPDAIRADLQHKWHVKPIELAANSYRGQTDAVATVGLTAAIFTSRDMPDLLVEALVTAVGRDKHYLEGVHAGFRSWEPKTMADSDGLPVHPAAERVYRANGWAKP